MKRIITIAALGAGLCACERNENAFESPMAVANAVGECFMEGDYEKLQRMQSGFDVLGDDVMSLFVDAGNGMPGLLGEDSIRTSVITEEYFREISNSLSGYSIRKMDTILCTSLGKMSQQEYYEYRDTLRKLRGFELYNDELVSFTLNFKISELQTIRRLSEQIDESLMGKIDNITNFTFFAVKERDGWRLSKYESMGDGLMSVKDRLSKFSNKFFDE